MPRWGLLWSMICLKVALPTPRIGPTSLPGRWPIDRQLFISWWVRADTVAVSSEASARSFMVGGRLQASKRAEGWATALENSNCSSTAATAMRCYRIIYLENTEMEGTDMHNCPTAQACIAVEPREDAPAILAIAAQCLSSAYQNKPTRRRTAE